MRRSENGQAMVEFALVLPIILLVVLGGLSLGSAFFKYQSLSHATSEGARRAIVSAGSSSPTAAVNQAVKDALPQNMQNDVNVTTTSTWEPGAEVTVKSSYPLDINVMGIIIFNDNIESETTMRVLS